MSSATIDRVAQIYPLNLPAKHIEKRIPATLTMTKILMYYTLWNWIVLVIALLTKNARITQYSKASSLLIACIIAVAWLLLGWPFFKQFYGGVLKTQTPWIIVWADAIFHFAPVIIMGLPSYLAVPVFMPFITFWIWYIAMRPHLMSLYGRNDDEFSFDKVVMGGTIIWLFILFLLI